jgi:magnesium chelatase subunit H
MLEANGRGFWSPDPEKLAQLRQLYELTDEELEGITV